MGGMIKNDQLHDKFYGLSAYGGIEFRHEV